LNSIGSPDEARLRTFWNDRYNDFTLSESGWRGAGEDLNRLIYACKLQALGRSLAQLGRRRSDAFSVLDAGCGQGFFARFYEETFPNAAYVGIDISERAVGHLRTGGFRGEFHEGDATSWRHPLARTFDVVQSLEVLHLILDDDAFVNALGNLAAQTAAGGSMLVTAALPDSTETRGDYLRYRSRRFWSETLTSLDLQIVSSRPIYYWLPSGGPSNRYLRFVVTRLGTRAMYALDRAAMALHVPRSRRSGPDSRMHLLTIRRIGC
jgi:SAM-dependent methyltransferase